MRCRNWQGEHPAFTCLFTWYLQVQVLFVSDSQISFIDKMEHIKGVNQKGYVLALVVYSACYITKVKARNLHQSKKQMSVE